MPGEQSTKERNEERRSESLRAWDHTITTIIKEEAEETRSEKRAKTRKKKEKSRSAAADLDRQFMVFLFLAIARRCPLMDLVESTLRQSSSPANTDPL